MALLVTALDGRSETHAFIRAPIAGANCRAANEHSDYRLEYVVRLVTGTDSDNATVRAALPIPIIPDTAIALVTDAAICQQALQAYEEALGVVKAGRQVFVYRAGSYYFVEDPERLTSGWRWLPVFTNSFQFLNAVLT